MRILFAAAAMLACPALVAAQQPQPADSAIHQHGDTLTRTPVQLQEITVTTQAPRREEPSSATRVTAATIRETPAPNAYQLLRETAGIEVHDQGQGPGFASDASVRGFSSDHSTDLALWIDGVPINEPVNGHAEGYNDWYVLFPQAVSEVDVLKGPVSALYGNFAMAGVVNVRTLERMTGSDARLTAGSWGRVGATAMTGWSHDHSSGVFGVRGLREDGWRRNSGYWLGQGHARYVRDLSDRVSLDAGAELYGSDWDSPGFLTVDQYDARDFQRVSDRTDGGTKRRAQERLSLRVIPSPSLVWRSTAYATQSRWELFLTTPPEGGEEEGTGSQTEEQDHRYGFGLTSALTWAHSRGQITAGAEGRWDHADYGNWLTTQRERQGDPQVRVIGRQASGALFVQSRTDVGHHLRIQAGARYDLLDTRCSPLPDGTCTNAAGSDITNAVSHTRGVISPKLGVLYHLHRAADLYVNVSRGFRSTDGVLTEPGLPLITEWAYEAGVKVDVPHFSASAAFFRMDVSNEQTFNPITLESTSGGASRRQGVELQMTTHLAAPLLLRADWTFNDAKYQHLVSEDGDTLSGARVFNTAKYVGSASLTFQPVAHPWRVSLLTNVVGPYTPFDEPGVELPAYALLHASASTLIDRYRLSVGVHNLLDQTYPELRAGGFIVPGQPRSVTGSVEVLF